MEISTNTLRKLLYVMGEKSSVKYLMAQKIRYTKHKGVLVIDTVFDTFYVVPEQLEKRTLGYIINQALVPIWIFGKKIQLFKVPFTFEGEFSYLYMPMKIKGVNKTTEFEIVISTQMLKTAKEK